MGNYTEQSGGDHERTIPQDIESLIERNHATLKRIDSIMDKMKTQERAQQQANCGGELQ